MKYGKIAILMGTHQGEEFLEAQLNSFSEQTYKHWELWASDDGSQDGTLTILKKFQLQHPGTIHILNGACRGFSHNFLSLACNNNIDADYYGFSDQDDIWHRNKLERALGWLSKQPHDIPCLYCSRTNLIDKEGTLIGSSPLFSRSPGFTNALVQNIAGGNTMVINKSARNLLLQAGVVEVNSHDWWTYIIIAGAGGHIYYDSEPSLDYRQHADNLMGSNLGWQASYNRIRKLSNGLFRKWNEQHLVALKPIQNLLTPQNKKILEDFIKIRNCGLFTRLWYLKKTRFYRQTQLGNLGLITAAIMKRI